MPLESFHIDQQLPPDFQARMEDETPVTAHNLLEYLAEYWTAEHNVEFGGCLARTILGPSKNCFINMLRNAWTKPDNGDYIACMQMDTELNRLYPNASVKWEPPRVFKEPIVATLQVTHV